MINIDEPFYNSIYSCLEPKSQLTHFSQYGSKWSHSKIGTNGPCVYTRTLGTFWNRYPYSFGSSEGTVVFGTVPFGSSENGQNGYLMRDNSFVCFIISRPKYQRKLNFCDLVHHPTLLLFLLEPFGTFSRLYLKYGTVTKGTIPKGTVPFSQV